MSFAFSYTTLFELKQGSEGGGCLGCLWQVLFDGSFWSDRRLYHCFPLHLHSVTGQVSVPRTLVCSFCTSLLTVQAKRAGVPSVLLQSAIPFNCLNKNHQRASVWVWVTFENHLARCGIVLNNNNEHFIESWAIMLGFHCTSRINCVRVFRIAQGLMLHAGTVWGRCAGRSHLGSFIIQNLAVKMHLNNNNYQDERHISVLMAS